MTVRHWVWTTCALLILTGSEVQAETPWPIEWVRLEGDFEHVSAEQVRAVAAPLVRNGFFGLRLRDVQSAVEALPWIKAAGVRKVWPDTVVIRIEEHVPMVRWIEGQLISDTGEVFELPPGAQIQTLPALEGPADRADQMVQFFRTAQEVLAGTGLSMARVHLSRRGAWTVELGGGQRLALGSKDIINRLDRFRSAWLTSFRNDSRILRTADLRYPSGLSVQWVEQGAVALGETQREDFDG